jgi:hypothetical protein
MSQHRMNRADIVVLSILAFMLFFLGLPLLAAELNKERELANRAGCAGNLRQIMQQLNVYAAANIDEFPSIPPISAEKYSASFTPELLEDSPEDALHSYYVEKPKQSGDITANLWILNLKKLTKPSDFLCKSDPFLGKAPSPLSDNPDKPKKFYNNFGDPGALSYSSAFPWGKGARGKLMVANQWKAVTDSSLPVVSDMAPYFFMELGKEDLVVTPMSLRQLANDAAAQTASQPSPPAKGPPKISPAAEPEVNILVNSPNHLGAGMNVGYSDGHTSWERRPDVGQNEDNIWTVTVNGKPKIIGPGDLRTEVPMLDNGLGDVIMVPTRDIKGGVH